MRLSRLPTGAVKMAPQGKVPGGDFSSLSLILWTHMVEGEGQLPQLVL